MRGGEGRPRDSSGRSFPLLCRFADRRAGGARQGVDRPAPSFACGGFQTVREPVLRSRRRTLRAARPSVGALKGPHRRIPLRRPSPPRRPPVRPDRRAGRPRSDGPCCGPDRNIRPAPRKSSTTCWRVRGACPATARMIHAPASCCRRRHCAPRPSEWRASPRWGFRRNANQSGDNVAACRLKLGIIGLARVVSLIALWARRR
jgi:hypothetical protein